MAVLTWHREKSFLASGWYRAENYSPVLPNLRRRPASGASARGGPKPREGRSFNGCGGDVGKDEQLEAQLPRLQATPEVQESTELAVQRRSTPDCGAPASLAKLAELSFYGERISTPDLVKTLSARRGLRTLHVPECEIADLSPVLMLESLRELKAARCYPGVTEDFVASLQALTKLEVLDLSFCPGVTDSSLSALCRGCRGLRRLELCSCPGVSDAGIMALATANPCLEELSLALDAERPTAEGMAKAVQRMRRLRRLDLSGCPQLGDPLPPALVLHCEYIEELSFASCAEISNEDVQQILTRCTHLERLNLTGCSSVSEEMLLEAVPLARKLKWIALSALPEVSEDAVVALQRFCPGLSVQRHYEGPKDPRDLSYVLPPPKPKAKAKSKARSASSKGGKASRK